MNKECIYCKEPYGKNIKVNQSCDNKNCITDTMISHTKDDNKAGFVLFERGMAKGWFDINYCPFCGRKLPENVEEIQN